MVAAAATAAADTVAAAGEAAADIVAAAATTGACTDADLAIIGQQQLMLKELQALQQQQQQQQQPQQQPQPQQKQKQTNKPEDSGFRGAFLSIGRLAGSAAVAAARAHAAAAAAADATAAVAAALEQSGSTPHIRFGSSSSSKHRESLDAAVAKGAEASREAAHAAQYAGAAAAAAAAAATTAAHASKAAVIAAAAARQEKKPRTGPRPSTPFLRLLDECARRALGDGPRTTACLLQQVQQQMQQSVSPGCASCFGTTAACAAKHCRRMCFANTCSPKCIECPHPSLFAAVADALAAAFTVAAAAFAVAAAAFAVAAAALPFVAAAVQQRQLQRSAAPLRWMYTPELAPSLHRLINSTAAKQQQQQQQKAEEEEEVVVLVVAARAAPTRFCFCCCFRCCWCCWLVMEVRSGRYFTVARLQQGRCGVRAQNVLLLQQHSSRSEFLGVVAAAAAAANGLKAEPTCYRRQPLAVFSS
ncbi:hypothetical protein Emed_004633 [Eimeria media]